MLIRDRKAPRSRQRMIRTSRTSRLVLPSSDDGAFLSSPTRPSKTSSIEEILGRVRGLSPESQGTELARAQWLVSNVATHSVALELLFAYLLDVGQEEPRWSTSDDIEVEAPPLMPPILTRQVRVRVLGRQRVEPKTQIPPMDLLPPPGD